MKIHYSGGVRIINGNKVKTIYAGFPACSNAKPGISKSDNIYEVTCNRCLKLVEMSGKYND